MSFSAKQQQRQRKRQRKMSEISNSCPTARYINGWWKVRSRKNSKCKFDVSASISTISTMTIYDTWRSHESACMSLSRRQKRVCLSTEFLHINCSTRLQVISSSFHFSASNDCRRCRRRLFHSFSSICCLLFFLSLSINHYNKAILLRLLLSARSNGLA